MAKRINLTKLYTVMEERREGRLAEVTHAVRNGRPVQKLAKNRAQKAAASASR